MLPGRSYALEGLSGSREDGVSERCAVRQDAGERGGGSRPGDTARHDLPGRTHPWGSAEKWMGAGQRRDTSEGD